MTFALTLMMMTSLGVLIGSIVFLSFVFAPVVFQVLEGGPASRLLRAVFPRYYRLGLVCCALGLASAAVLTANDPSILTFGCSALLTATSVITSYSLRLVPRINAARDSGSTARFEALHRRSVVMNGASLILAVGAFMLAASINT